ncbi:Gfo/Idh/MocA family oxidoreductase [Colwellia demingiae]|uniref:Gfo/Idh/MocA family oxidoreductase n=1 Tax=Colwellia demingiae TaxID=89401 RepID=A0A5C6Q6Z0_9GAMM|nr:Gfo/Idh/MocA family oxidoreductase [Colwellia demingiae]TWX64347.1 Gfo/Idh/MocA family oxidoreductase [Colwellia demingiae]
MRKTIGVGVIGMGWMGECHSRSYKVIADRFYDQNIDPRLVICSDSVEERARDSQHRFGFEEYTTDWKQVIAHPDVDVVNITAPTGMHLELIKAAAEAGKHVYCEKPAGKNPQEIAEAEAIARQYDVLSMIGYNYRWAPVVQYARKLILDGKLGRLTHYRGRFLNCYASDPHSLFSWRFQKENGHGTLTDLMSHTIDMAHMLVGPVKRLTSNIQIIIKERPLPTEGTSSHYAKGNADSPMASVTNDDYVSALLEFENGVTGTIESCRVINGPKTEMGFELHGTEGALRWNFEQMNELQLQYRNNEAGEEGYTTIYSSPAHPNHERFNPAPGTGLGYDDLKVIECFEFLKAVSNGTEADPSLKEALAVAKVQQAILASWDKQAWVDVEK